MESRIIIPLDEAESVEEVLLHATSNMSRGDTAITRLPVFPVGEG